MSLYNVLSVPRCHWQPRAIVLLEKCSRGIGCCSGFRQFCMESKNVEPVSEVLTRMIAKDDGEAALLKNETFRTPLKPRILTATILGLPNAGKSTLTNALMGWRVCSVSKKVHTTLRNVKAVLIEDDAQIVLLDTPGIVSKSEKRRHDLNSRMLTDPGGSISNADLIIALVDISHVWHQERLDLKLLSLLKEYSDKPSILVLNKIDLLANKRRLLDITRKLTDGIVGSEPIYGQVKREEKPGLETILSKAIKESKGHRLSEETESVEINDKCQAEEDSKRGWPHFQRVFMISAKERDGVENLKEYLYGQTKYGSWLCKPHVVTNQTPQEIAKLAVREKLLDHLQQEIPYNITLRIEMWSTDEHGTLRIAMTVYCPSDRHMKLVIGNGGRIVSAIAAEARQELMNTFRCEVSLKLIVKSTNKKSK